MNVTWLEMKKVILSPTFIVLLLLMFIWNGVLINDYKYMKNDVNSTAQFIANYDQSVNDETIALMENDVLYQIKGLGYSSTEQFYNYMTAEAFRQLSEDNQIVVEQLHIQLSFIHYARFMYDNYVNLAIDEFDEKFMKVHTMPNWLEAFYKKQFLQFKKRHQAVITSNEHADRFFTPNFKMHSFLFGKLTSWLILEAVLLSILLTAVMMNYEYDMRAQQVIYATKRGRKLRTNKIVASIMVSFMYVGILFLITYSTYFSLFDYTAIWSSSVSNAFNWEHLIPYMTWWEMSYKTYFLLTMLVISVILLIVQLMTVSVSLFLKNSYSTWLVMAVILLAIFVVPRFMSDGVILWLMHFNLVLLMFNPDYYFTVGDTYIMMKYHEIYTLIIWGVIALSCLCIGIRYDYRKEVK